MDVLLLDFFVPKPACQTGAILSFHCGAFQSIAGLPASAAMQPAQLLVVGHPVLDSDRVIFCVIF
jgi:hypothetical protein